VRAQSVDQAGSTADDAHRGRLLREAGRMAPHCLRRQLDQARAAAVLLEQGQPQRAEPMGQTRVGFRPDPRGAEVKAVRGAASGQTKDAPADAFTGLDQGDVQADAIQQVRGHQARQACSYNHYRCICGYRVEFRWTRIGAVCVQGHGGHVSSL